MTGELDDMFNAELNNLVPANLGASDNSGGPTPNAAKMVQSKKPPPPKRVPTENGSCGELARPFSLSRSKYLGIAGQAGSCVACGWAFAPVPACVRSTHPHSVSTLLFSEAFLPRNAMH